MLAQTFRRCVSLCLATVFILQCKQSAKVATQVSALNGTCSMQFGLVGDPFNLGTLVKIDASKLQVQSANYVTLSYADNQSTLLLSVDTLPSSDANLFADFAAYSISDANQKVCVSGKTGASFTSEIYIPPTCNSKTLTIKVQACAIPARLLNSQVSCGPVKSVAYANTPNSKSSDIGSVLSLTQENEKELALVSSWLSARAGAFLGSVGSPTSLTTAQQLEIALAQLFVRQQTSFAEIFSGPLYTELQNSASYLASSTSTDTSLGLADTSNASASSNSADASYCSSSSASYASSASSAAQDQINADLGQGETTADLNAILDSARETYGATSGGIGTAALAIIDAPTDTDTSTQITNNAQTVDMTTNSPAATIAGSVLIVAAVIWGAYVVANIAIGSREAAQKALFLKESPKFLDGNTTPLTLDKSTIRWVNTADGKSKILTYKTDAKGTRYVVISNTDPATSANKPYKLVTIQEAGIDVSKQPWYKFTNRKIASNSTNATKPAILSDFIAGVQKAPTTSEALKSNLKVPLSSTTLHTMGIGTLLGTGIAILAVTGQSNLALATTGDVYSMFANDMKAAQQAISSLQNENDSLQSVKTNLVVNKLTGS